MDWAWGVSKVTHMDSGSRSGYKSAIFFSSAKCPPHEDTHKTRLPGAISPPNVAVTIFQSQTQVDENRVREKNPNADFIFGSISRGTTTQRHDPGVCTPLSLPAAPASRYLTVAFS